MGTGHVGPLTLSPRPRLSRPRKLRSRCDISLQVLLYLALGPLTCAPRMVGKPAMCVLKYIRGSTSSPLFRLPCLLNLLHSFWLRYQTSLVK